MTQWALKLRPHARVLQWQAERSRKAARAGTDPGRARRYNWPADREAIVGEMTAAAVRQEHHVTADLPAVCG